MTLLQIQAAMAAATATATANPQPAAPTDLGDGTTVQTDIYEGPLGAGFVVTAVLPNGLRFSIQSGPETWRAVSYQVAYAAMKPLLNARALKMAALAASLRAQLLSQFNSWTPVQRAVMNGARLAINDMLLSGDMADAIAAVSGYPLPGESYAVLQAAILADLTTYAPLFEAVEAASTVAAVNAVVVPTS